MLLKPSFRAVDTSTVRYNSSTNPSEHEEQSALMDWAELGSRIDPRLLLLFAIPNGGHRHIGVARQLRDEGVKPGVPDLFLPVPSKGFHGLFIEMKSLKGRPTPEQSDWLVKLAEQGYKVAWCRGCEAAIAVIEEYLCQTST